MNRVLNRACKFIAITGLFFSSIALGKPVDKSKNILATDLLHKLSRTRLIELFGAEHLQDSVTTSEGVSSKDLLEQTAHSGSKNKQRIDKKKFLFAPIQFEGVPAIVEATMINDSTAFIQVYLLYIGRPTTRLKFPFEMTNFVRGTAEDYNQVERKIEDELGIPTVLTNANFEYLSGNTQSIFGVFENGEIRITIIPQVSP